MSIDIIRAEVRIGRPRDSMCKAHGIIYRYKIYHIDKIKKMIRLGYSREDIIELEYTEEEFCEATKELSTNA